MKSRFEKDWDDDLVPTPRADAWRKAHNETWARLNASVKESLQEWEDDLWAVPESLKEGS